MGTQERRARERESRRKRIIDAATELFVRDGFASTGVADIAARAELNVATLYYYFSSKEIIYLAVLVRALDLLIPKLDEAAAKPGSARDRLSDVAHTYHEFFTEHPESQAIIHCLQSGLIEPANDEEAKLIAHAYRGTGSSIGIVARIIKDGTESGDFRSLDTRETTLMFWAGLSGILQLADHKEVFRSSIKDGLLERWIDLVVTGLEARSP